MTVACCRVFWLLTGLIAVGQMNVASAAKLRNADVSTARLQRLTIELQQRVQQGQFSGVVTMVAKDGKVVQVDAVGKRDLESGDAMKPDTIFRIYSMTKPVTGVAMMMLFEEGKWQLNDPVSKYIPEFANLKVAQIDSMTGELKTVAPEHPMTMRELMSHTGGFTYGGFGSTAIDKLYTDAVILDPYQPLQTMIDKLAKIPLLFQPGTHWHYSVAADVQGYLVEKLSGQPLPEFFRERIFKPLKMNDTGFSVPHEKLQRLASYYTYDKDRKLVPHPSWDYSEQPVLFSGGGGLVSTASDYMRFCQMLLNGGEFDGHRLLSPPTVRLMRTDVLPPSLGPVVPGIGFGLDLAVVEDLVDAGGYWSEGTFYFTGYAGTWFWIDPAYNLIVVGMVQQRGDGAPDLAALSRNLVYQAILH